MSEAPAEASNVPPNTGLGLGLGIPFGGHLPHSARNQTSPDMSNFADGSWRIFSMYLERAKEEDEKIAESWQADANGILVFVRPSPNTVLRTELTVHRLVYSPLRSHLCSRCQFRTFGRTHRTPLTSTSRAFIRVSPTQIGPMFRVPSRPPHHHFLHPPMPFG